MNMRHLLIGIIAVLMSATAGCAILDGDEVTENTGETAATTVQQPVFIAPVFVLDGLDELPRRIHLDTLHLGVGAIFLDLIDESDDGVIYANETPFQLHFDIENGQVVAEGPLMVLPRGGDYQVSLQIEPRPFLRNRPEDSIRSLQDNPDEASLVVTGTVKDSSWSDDDDDEEEPIPDTWLPEGFEDVHRLTRTTSEIPFAYHSDRMVRFTIDNVQLIGGSSIELVMQLQVGDWVVETIQPALDNALGDMSREELEDPLEGRDINLNEQLDEMGDGMDSLIGGMDVEVR